MPVIRRGRGERGGDVVCWMGEREERGEAVASAGLTRTTERGGPGQGVNDSAGEIDAREEREGATAPARSTSERRGQKRWYPLD
eukprot:2083320-Rhodomonas_salina.2